MAQQQESSAVFVCNISPSAQQKAVTDFFAYCGTIKEIKLWRAKDNTQAAVVVFEAVSSARTALLLSDALIVDKAISVVPFSGAPDQQAPGEENAQPVTIDGSQIEQRPPPAEGEQHSMTSVVASMIVGGYSLGANVFQSAKSYDEQHGITTQLKTVGETVKTKATEIDTQYGFSNKLAQLGNAISALDTSYGISQKAVSGYQAVVQTATEYGLPQKAASGYHAVVDTTNAAAESVKQATHTLAQKAYETPVLSSGMKTLESVAQSLSEAVTEVTVESKAGISALQPPIVPASATAEGAAASTPAAPVLAEGASSPASPSVAGEAAPQATEAPAPAVEEKSAEPEAKQQ
eukprot:TRINITY_DN164_c2_g1_i1.p1 TRINITY_DN164_c2_g1~~TRINITY_DN164_c2_g1_i1.p1  ORF type:complete len:349 (-),score=110.42 TRINITY_DN164_c2_g1_i1:119-1165(-)